jgi:hypothetical protein
MEMLAFELAVFAVLGGVGCLVAAVADLAYWALPSESAELPMVAGVAVKVPAKVEFVETVADMVLAA